MKKTILAIVALCAAAIAPAVSAAQSAVYALGEKLADLAAGHMARSGLVLFAFANGVPTKADFNARRVTNPNQSEIIRQRLYDWQLYPAAGVAQLTFFQQPAGGGITTAQGAVVGSAKTLWDTNMTLQGQLASGQEFMAESIEVVLLPGSVSTTNTYTPAAPSQFAVAAAATLMGAANDVNSFYQSGMLEFNISSKNYLRETPLMAFPPKTAVSQDVATSTNSATVGEVAAILARAGGRPYYLEPEISLQPAVNFEVVLKWPAAVALPSGFNGRVGVILDGYFMRASQ